jgi:anti-sigma regulatory factor (Ser/Thr protein kinase)
MLPPPILPVLQAVDDHWPRWAGVELGVDPTAVRRARAHALEILWEWDLLELSDDIALIVSELTTNAIQTIQAGSGGDPVRLWLVANSTHIAILVWDPASTTPRMRDVTSDDESGRGLAIVEALSTEWGWGFLSESRAGKVVWALLEIANTKPTQESPMQPDALFPFERANLEKLRLACQVILDQAAEPFISDSLEEELYGLRDEIDRVLLLPDRPVVVA